MDITIHTTFLPHDDPEAALAFYRDTLGFEVCNDVDYNGMRWIAAGPVEPPSTSGADVIQEPTEQPYGVRDGAVRDPAGNHVRINEVG
jgi:uncharacterized glyoxalase superfamily protein PhnB